MAEDSVGKLGSNECYRREGSLSSSFRWMVSSSSGGSLATCPKCGGEIRVGRERNRLNSPAADLAG